MAKLRCTENGVNYLVPPCTYTVLNECRYAAVSSAEKQKKCSQCGHTNIRLHKGNTVQQATPRIQKVYPGVYKCYKCILESGPKK